MGRLRSRQFLLDAGAVAAVALGAALILGKHAATARVPVDRIVNVSYDPTRELFKAIDPLFVDAYQKATGRHVTIEQSHGGSSRQARKIISGEQPADVVSLGLRSDVDSLRKRGLIADGWENRLPHGSVPYTSTIVFVIRGSNPRGIKDWPDLVQPGVEVVTPDPRSSSNGKLAALAAWLAVTTRGGSEQEAKDYLRAFYAHVPELAEGARGASTTFSDKEVGDVHVTWENEALREVAAAKGKLQIVYPPVSILAEPYVAWVDKAVAQHGTAAISKAFLEYLFTEEAQEVIARLGYRPFRPEAAEKAGVHFADAKLVPMAAISPDWAAVNDKFFAENGIVTSIVEGLKK